MNPIQKLGLKTKKRVVSISNKIKYDLLDYYFDPSVIVELHKNFGRDKIDSILNKFSKKRVVQEIKLLMKLTCLGTQSNHCREKLLLKEQKD